MTYQQPQYVQPQRPPSNGVAIASMVLGIIAIAIGVWSIVPLLGLAAAITAFVPAVVAVILGHMGLGKSAALNGLGRGQAATGLITGYITLAIIVLTTIFWIVAMGSGS